MKAEDAAKKVLDTMLGHLGFASTIELEQHEDGPCLMIDSPHAELLIGEDGDRLDDLQYLVNRVLRKHYEESPRVKVDCGSFRLTQEAKLRQEVDELAQRVLQQGKALQMRPLNAYFRRLVYSFVAAHAGLEAHSPEGSSRLKRITLKPKA